MSEIHVSREDAKARRDIEEVAAIVVDGQLIVELKSVENIHPVHPKQLLTYLRLMNLPLLINFGAPLLKDGLQRVVNKHTNFASSRLRVHQQEAHKGGTHYSRRSLGLFFILRRVSGYGLPRNSHPC